MKHVVLHIGTGKTGTSTIQNALYHSRKALKAKHSIDYARIFRIQINHFGESIAAHYRLAEVFEHKVEKDLEKFRNYILNSPEQTVIFSCENFYHHLSEDDVGLLASLLQNCRVTVVCYVRRQDLYVESAYKQQVKVGVARAQINQFLAQHTKKECLLHAHANYYRMLLKWDHHFGTEAIKVRLFDPSCFKNGNLLDDFVATAGLGNVTLRLGKKENTNRAMPSELIQAIRAFNELGIVPKDEHQQFVEDLRTRFDFVDYPLVSPGISRRIQENYEESNTQLFQRFKIDDRWSAALTDEGAAPDPEVKRRTDIDLLANVMYASWQCSRNPRPAISSKKRLYFFFSDILFYFRVKYGSYALSTGISRNDYLRLLAKMMMRRDFSPSFYLCYNPDVSISGMDPVTHYLRYGCDEGRLPHPSVGEAEAKSIADSCTRGDHPYLGNWRSM